MQKQAAEQPREDADRQEEAGPASDPACAVGRRSTTRHDTVDMRMVLQGLAPGMEDGGHAELGTEMLGSAAMVVSASAAQRNRMA